MQSKASRFVSWETSSTYRKKELADKERDVEKEKQELERQKIQIANSKKDAEKRHRATEAIAKHKVQEESNRLQERFEKNLKDNKKTLEAKIQKQKDNSEKRVVQLQDENSKLLAKVKEHQQQIETQKINSDKAKEEINDNEMVKRSLKRELNSLKAQLKAAENEFKLNTHTLGH